MSKIIPREILKFVQNIIVSSNSSYLFVDYNLDLIIHDTGYIVVKGIMQVFHSHA